MSNRNQRDKQSARNYARIVERILAIIGALTLLAIAAFVIGVLYTYYVENNMNPSANRYASESGLAILSAHSEQEMQSLLLQRLSPKAQTTTTKAGIDQIVETVNKLGKLEEYKGVMAFHIQTGLLSLSKGVGEELTYDARATFENGTGLVRMTLVPHGDGWQINGFYVTATTNPH